VSNEKQECAIPAGMKQSRQWIDGIKVEFLQQIFESFQGNFSRVKDLLKRPGLNEVLARDNDDMFIVGHGNVLALP
jgi:hypothetical protein